MDLEETNITTLKMRNVRRAGFLFDDNNVDVLDEKLAKVKVGPCLFQGKISSLH